MELYAENYRHLTGLFVPTELVVGRYLASSSQGCLRLIIDVMECHRYTFFLRLAYNMLDPLTGQPDPSAYIRVYCDTRQAEMTHCYLGQRMQDALGFHPPPAVMIHHRLRINTFLGKWLLYLKESGYGDEQLVPWHRSDPVPLILPTLAKCPNASSVLSRRS